MRRITEAAGATAWVVLMGCVAWIGWQALRATHAEACAIPATMFEVGKQMLCGGHARDLVSVMFTAVSPLLAPLLLAAICAIRHRKRGG